MADTTEPQITPLVTREEARAAGAKVYTDALPCKRGHTQGRYVINGSCIRCTRVSAASSTMDRISKAGGAEIFSGNPCRICGSLDRYTKTDACVSCSRQRTAARREKRIVDNDGDKVFAGLKCDICNGQDRYTTSGACVTCCKKQRQARYQNDPDKARTQNRIWKELNPDRYRELGREWYRNHPESRKAKDHRRRALIVGCEGSHTRQDIEGLYKKQKGRCVICFVKLNKKYHMDHVVPLSKGGTNWISNIQLTCKACNLRKGAKDPIDYAREIGLLI